MRRPLIITELPGPRATAFIERDNRFISHSLPREYPLVIDKGKGVWVDDPDGNTFLDFTSGIAVCNTGHCHPEVVEAAKDQLSALISSDDVMDWDKGSHGSTYCGNELQVTHVLSEQ